MSAIAETMAAHDKLLLDRTRPGDWYVVETQERFERIVRDRLMRLDLNAYLPMVPVQRRHARATVERMEPLFTGYLFVQAARASGLDPVYGMIGVERVLTLDKIKPAVIPTAELYKLDDVVVEKRAEFERRRRKANHLFKPGDTVRVKVGLWEGFIALLDKVKRDQLKVRLDIFGRSTEVTVSPQHVELLAAT